MDFIAYEKLNVLNIYETNYKQRHNCFMDAINESYKFHYNNCEAYKKFCLKRGFNINSKFYEVSDIPYLPVQAFKIFDETVLSSLKKGERNITLSSSATSGKPSSIVIDKMASRRQIKAMSNVMIPFIGKQKRPFIIFDIDPFNNNNKNVSARYGATAGFINFSSKSYFVLKQKKNGILGFDLIELKKAIAEIKNNNQSPIIFGFTYVLYDLIKNFNDPNNLFKHLLKPTVIHIGGWKKLETLKISKNSFNNDLSKKLHVQINQIFDIYGFTEQMGIVYPSSGSEEKLTSILSDVLVRDPNTFEILPDGEEGLLQFISPMPTSYPGLSILTDDLGIISGYKTIKNINGFGKSFRITGRAKNAEIRGCGDIMSEIVTSETKNKTLDYDKNVFVLFNKKITVNSNNLIERIDKDKIQKLDDMKILVKDLRAARKLLTKYSIDELIGFFSNISNHWLDDNSPLSQFKQHGLSFLINWVKSSNLRKLCNQGLNNQRSILDGFQTDISLVNRQIKAVPAGVVGHWLAGNVPLLGMLGLIQSIITKNANIIRLPSHNTGVLPIFLDVISKSKTTLSNGTTVYGKDLVEATALIHFDKYNIKAAEQMSKLVDIRIAWGGKESVEAVMNLPKKHNTEDIIFGPKLSFSVIGKEALSEGQNINKLTRRIATDVCVFDQYACASPHTLFVEENNHLKPFDFAKLLAKQIEVISKRIPKERSDPGIVSNIISKRLEYEFTENMWASNDTDWTVLFDNKGSEGLVNPTYSRVITVRSINDIMNAAKFANQNIQTISIASSLKRKLQFAEIASELGALRFPEVGRMTHFDSPWDGINLVNRLVKFVSLGGPSV